MNKHKFFSAVLLTVIFGIIAYVWFSTFFQFDLANLKHWELILFSIERGLDLDPFFLSSLVAFPFIGMATFIVLTDSTKPIKRVEAIEKKVERPVELRMHTPKTASFDYDAAKPILDAVSVPYLPVKNTAPDQKPANSDPFPHAKWAKKIAVAFKEMDWSLLHTPRIQDLSFDLYAIAEGRVAYGVVFDLGDKCLIDEVSATDQLPTWMIDGERVTSPVARMASITENFEQMICKSLNRDKNPLQLHPFIAFSRTPDDFDTYAKQFKKSGVTTFCLDHDDADTIASLVPAEDITPTDSNGYSVFIRTLANYFDSSYPLNDDTEPTGDTGATDEKKVA